jgi:hypothetical protein
MYTVSIPIFIQHLNGLNAVLDKAATWAAARKVNEADLLNMRLSPDMFNLTRQVQAATDHAANAAGRLAGKELLKFTNDETTIAQLKDRIAKTIDYLKSVKQSEIRRHRGQGHQHHLPKWADTPIHRAESTARQQSAKLLVSHHHCLRYRPAVRHRGRQARLHGHATVVVSPAANLPALRSRIISRHFVVSGRCPLYRR